MGSKKRTYESGWKPEPALKSSAENMLQICFDAESTADEADAAATTLVEIVAPEILESFIANRNDMISVVLMIEVGDVSLEREIKMPFAPVPGMDLMLDVSAWWNQMRFDEVMWYDDLQELQCVVSLHDARSPDNVIIDVLTRNNWVRA